MQEGSLIEINSSPIFGVAGFPPAFFKSDFGKKRENVFAWLSSLGLNWIELQNTYGVKMRDDQATLYNKLATEHNIGISIHAPYYITLASGDSDVVKRSKERFLQCFALAYKLNSQRIIFHPGHYSGNGKDDRKRAVIKIANALKEIKHELPKGVIVYPETAGKRSQIGSIEEILDICELVDYARPCIDVAHIHGFEGGTLTTQENIIKVLDKVIVRFGIEYLKQAHFHMYPIEVDRNGEKKHKAFHDRIGHQQLTIFETIYYDKYYPIAEDFISAIKIKNIQPVVICEARDSQESGALLMKSFFYNEGQK